MPYIASTPEPQRKLLVDVLLAARHLAERQGKSMGEVISILARQGLQGDAPRKVATVRNGVPLLHGREGPLAVTLELVNQLRDEPA